VERRNKMVVEMDRCMLQHRKVPNRYREEPIPTKVYMLYRGPTKVVRNVTPKQACPRRKPHGSHLKIFGFVAYVLIPNEKRSKLDPK
jgi:hypothetical protein